VDPLGVRKSSSKTTQTNEGGEGRGIGGKGLPQSVNKSANVRLTRRERRKKTDLVVKKKTGAAGRGRGRQGILGGPKYPMVMRRKRSQGARVLHR